MCLARLGVFSPPESGFSFGPGSAVWEGMVCAARNVCDSNWTEAEGNPPSSSPSPSPSPSPFPSPSPSPSPWLWVIQKILWEANEKARIKADPHLTHALANQGLRAAVCFLLAEMPGNREAPFPGT